MAIRISKNSVRLVTIPLNLAAEITVASATPNIGAAASNNLQITGTTTITAFDTVAAGITRSVRFAGALTLTHNGTSLILPGGVDITTVADDRANFLSLGSGNWICLNYEYAKKRAMRVTSITSSATPTPNADTTDVYLVTALAEGATFGAPTGTPTNGQQLIIRIKDDATARSLAWNAIYRASSDVALPTITALSKTLYCSFIYNVPDSKWDLFTISTGAPTNSKVRTIGFSSISPTTGQQGTFVVFPVAGTITGWSIVADTGTATVKVWKVATGTTAPTISNVINTSGVALSTGTAVYSTTVTDFTTTAVAANDMFAFDLTAVSGSTKLLFELEITVT